MSSLVFPSTLPGLKIEVKRKVSYSSKIQTASSGKELRASWWSTPKYRYSLSFSGLRQDKNGDEAAQLVAFFTQHQGRWDSFLFTDPYESGVTQKQFGTGNGSTVAFQLVDGGGLSVVDLNGTPIIYRTDWQGTQLLYTTPRTNYCLNSEDFSAATWYDKVGLTITPNAGTAPDGTNKATQISVAGGGRVFGEPSGSAGQYSQSIWVRLISGTPGITLNLKDRGTDTVRGTTGVITPTTNWQRIFVSGTTTIGICRCEFYLSGTGVVQVYAPQVNPGATATSYIPTTTAAVTVTDYTLSGTGLVTLATAPVSGATLTWTGSYYRRVRFDSDDQDLDRICDRIWELKSLELISVK